MLTLQRTVLHALYYLAKVMGFDVGYSFTLEGYGVYSHELARDLDRGKPRKLPAKAGHMLHRLTTMLCLNGFRRRCDHVIVVAARLHYIATQLYPPVDDPVEYTLLRFPGTDRRTAEHVLRSLRYFKVL